MVLGNKIVNKIEIPSVVYDKATYISHTSVVVATSEPLTISKPSNVAVGDLLLILVGGDAPVSSIMWDNVSNKPTGFTLLNEIGDSTYDIHCAVFWKIADGSEASTITIPSAADYAMERFCFYIHIKGNSTNISTIDYTTSIGETNQITFSLSTSFTGLSIAFVTSDGGDCYPFSIYPTYPEWQILEQLQYDTNSGTVAGCLAMAVDLSSLKSILKINQSLTDGIGGFQLKLR